MERIGKYEILGEIGAGGFGTVYRGRDPILKRMVAIKTCSSEDDTLRLRFRREAEIVACLQHPNITTIHDLGEQDGVPYLVQEFLDGEDLSHVIGRRDEISIDQKARLLFGVASGLAHAHANGIIHRDIKPGNIRVLSNGSVKVMDFGIAKIGDVQTELTRTGMMLGTGPYLAPEQLTDEQLDSRCDIFSFGVVAYELFAYQRPFEASTFSALLYKILNQPHTPIREVCPDLPPPLVELVERCLIKDRDRRISSFEEIRSQLAQVLNISEERKLPLSASQIFVDRTVPYDSGSAASRGTDSQSLEQNATLLLSSTEASAASMAGSPAASAPAGPAATVAASKRGPVLIAGAVAAAVLAVAGAVWMKGGDSDAPASVPAALESSAPTPTRSLPAFEPGRSEATALTPPTPEIAAGAPTRGSVAEESAEPTESAATALDPTTEPTRSARPASRPADADTAGDPPRATGERAEREGESSARPRGAASRGEASAGPPARSASTGGAERSNAAAATPAVEPVDPPVVEVAADEAPRAPAPQIPPGDAGADRAARPEPAGSEPSPDPATAATAKRSPASTPSQNPVTQNPVTQPGPTPAPAGPDPAADEAAVRAALDRYRRAYEALDINALAAAWPSLDGESRHRIERGFGSYQALSMTIDGCRIEVAGASAVARCMVHQEVTPKGGRRLTSDREVEFRMTRRDDSWVIQSL